MGTSLDSQASSSARVCPCCCSLRGSMPSAIRACCSSCQSMRTSLICCAPASCSQVRTMRASQAPGVVTRTCPPSAIQLGIFANAACQLSLWIATSGRRKSTTSKRLPEGGTNRAASDAMHVAAGSRFAVCASVTLSWSTQVRCTPASSSASPSLQVLHPKSSTCRLRQEGSRSSRRVAEAGLQAPTSCLLSILINSAFSSALQSESSRAKAFSFSLIAGFTTARPSLVRLRILRLPSLGSFSVET
jgi:hypothetical protein